MKRPMLIWMSVAVLATRATGALRAQTVDAPSAVATARRTWSPDTSVSLGVAAQLTATRTGPYDHDAAGSQGFDTSAAVLFSVRQSFRPWLGYSVNLGYTRTTQQNVGGAFFDAGLFRTSDRFSIPANLYEVSVAYLAERHLSPRVTGFADVGGGVLGFLPVHRGATAIDYVPGHFPVLVPSYVSRPLGVAGVGVDLRLSRSLALRAEYRGLLFLFNNNQETVARETAVTSQPTLSLVYRFGRKP